MKTTILIFAVIIVLTKISFCQEMSISSAHFVIPDLAKRADVSGSVRAKFDVIGGEAKNIQIFPEDSLSKKYPLFNSVTIHNINQITFLTDKLNCTLLVNYIVHPAGTLSNDYGELISDSILNLVYRPQGMTVR